MAPLHLFQDSDGRRQQIVEIVNDGREKQVRFGPNTERKRTRLTLDDWIAKKYILPCFSLPGTISGVLLSGKHS
jgi:hypothetical protein